VHGVVVNVTIQDVEPALQTLREQIVPRASQAPGFVAGYWLKSEDDRGLSVIVAESEEAARGIAQMVQEGAQANPAVTLESVDVREVVANA
jgi:hypothetical protein